MIDRRIQKTKDILSRALVSLIREKDYDTITIQDILDRSNVGRSTFYTHFENKDQLLIAGNDNFKKILHSHYINGEFVINFSFFYQHIKDNYKLADYFFGAKGGDILQVFFRNLLTDMLLTHAKNKQKNLDRRTMKMLSFKTEALADAVIHLLRLWVEDKMQFTINEMVSMSNAILKPFLLEIEGSHN